MMRRHILRFLVAAMTLASATSALAHAHLEASAPAANATVAAPAQITLTFSEAVEPRFSGIVVTDAQGRTVNAHSHADPANAAVLVAMPAQALAPGLYHVSWHAVGDDGHRMTGTFDFTVQP